MTAYCEHGNEPSFFTKMSNSISISRMTVPVSVFYVLCTLRQIQHEAALTSLKFSYVSPAAPQQIQVFVLDQVLSNYSGVGWLVFSSGRYDLQRQLWKWQQVHHKLPPTPLRATSSKLQELESLLSPSPNYFKTSQLTAAR
jgi:hypothetical protein